MEAVKSTQIIFQTFQSVLKKTTQRTEKSETEDDARKKVIAIFAIFSKMADAEMDVFEK